MGWAVELFVSLADNARLDPMGFAPFGTITEEGMQVIDRTYAGYGECAEICAAAGVGATDPYCVPSASSASGWSGVNLTKWLAEGTDAYLARGFPKLDRVLRTELIDRERAGLRSRVEL